MKTWLTFSVLSILFFISISGISGCSDSSEQSGRENTPSQKAASKEIVSTQLPRLLDLGSVYCKPCKKMAPILDSLEIAYKGKAEIRFIDIKQDKQVARKYGITMIPTQIFFDAEGKEVYRHIGFFPADSITAHFEAIGVSL